MSPSHSSLFDWSEIHCQWHDFRCSQRIRVQQIRVQQIRVQQIRVQQIRVQQLRAQQRSSLECYQI